MISPIFYAPNLGLFFSLSEDDWDLVFFESLNYEKPIISYDCSNLQQFSHIYDIKFLEFLISKSLKKQEEFSSFLQICKELEKIQNISDNDYSQIKEYLLLLTRLTYEEKIIQLLERYRSYYDTIVRAFIFNTNHYASQKLYLDSDLIIQENYPVDTLDLKFDSDDVYIPVDIKHYNWSETGRINAAIFSSLSKIKKIIQPKNDYILEVDCQAAEWNYLLFMCSEAHLFPKNKKTYQPDLQNLLGCSELSWDLFKKLLYSYIYGSGVEAILKYGIEKSQFDMFVSMFRKTFPKTFDFCHKKHENKYLSKDSSVIYDYFGKEIFVDTDYKKLNYFLQSSLASHFQLFISNVIKEMQTLALKSRILLTIHDSVFIDVVASEKQEIFQILRKVNEDFIFSLVVKSMIQKRVINLVSELQQSETAFTT